MLLFNSRLGGILQCSLGGILDLNAKSPNNYIAYIVHSASKMQDLSIDCVLYTAKFIIGSKPLSQGRTPCTVRVNIDFLVIFVGLV